MYESKIVHLLVRKPTFVELRFFSRVWQPVDFSKVGYLVFGDRGWFGI